MHTIARFTPVALFRRRLAVREAEVAVRKAEVAKEIAVAAIYRKGLADGGRRLAATP